MTKEQFFSPTISDWIVEINKQHPHMTHEEFLQLFEEWFEKNEDSIVLNEELDLSKYARVDEKASFDDDFKFEEPDEDIDTDPDEDEDGDEIEPEEPEEEPVRPVKKASSDDDFEFEEHGDDEEEAFKDVEGGDKEIKEKPITIKPRSEDEKEKLVSKVKGKYLVNNGEDYEHNIFSVVNAWYDYCIKTGNGENMLEHNKITLLDTGVTTDMRALFAFANVPNLDLSGWDTSAVTNMEGMFYKSTFDNDSILDWDVSMCVNFTNMFESCRFSGDIKSHWTPGKVLKTVYDEFGKPKMIEAKDSDGKVIMEPSGKPKIKVEKIWVDAELPEVGNRKHGINDAKNKRIIDHLRELDRKDKDIAEKEKEEKMLSHMEESKKMKHVVDFEDFVNEGLGDKIKSGIKKIFNTIAAKLNDFYIAVFDKNGNPYNATSKYTTLNYVAAGNVPGAKAYSGASELLNDRVREKAAVPGDEGYYGVIEEGSREYKNYLTMLEMLAENKDNNVSEARMSLSAAGSGVDIEDVDSEQLKHMLKGMLTEAPAYIENGNAKSLLIFGAPGVGKSSIPQSIINAYNEEAEKVGKGKKALLTIECGDLTLDGLYLPIPEMRTLKDEALKHPEALKRIGFSDDAIEKLARKEYNKITEAPKSWLPVYEPSTDRDINIAQNAIANGRVIEKNVWDDALGEYVPVNEETTEGGIIMFDEFLRAEPEMFKILMQIALNRKFGENKFGSKWAFVFCSNRPNDDAEVKKAYKGLSVPAKTRFLKGVCNFIPDFYEWKKWAETEGGFDDNTLEFLSRSTDGNKETYKVKSVDGEKFVTAFKNWHNVDSDNLEQFTAPTPRTWSSLMDEINKEIKNEGVESILDLPNGWIKQTAAKIIGAETGDRYANYLNTISGKKGLKIKEMMSVDGYNVDTEAFPCTEVTKRVEDFLRTHYYRRGGEVKLPTDKELFLMTKNMDSMYADNAGSFIAAMHLNIVQDIFKIKSTDTAIIKKLHNYLKIVGKRYGIEYADEKPINIE